jgi:hypothetical protein
VIGPTLVEKIVAVHGALDAAGVPHAFGGALALAYHTNEVRATKDIDVNVFAGREHAEQVLEALPEGVASTIADVARIRRDGQVRVWWAETPVDLFFDQHDVHRQAADHTLTVPFADTELPVLGSTELTVFKMMYSRPQDWVDVEAMLDARTVDAESVRATYGRIMGADDPALERFDELARGYAA